MKSRVLWIVLLLLIPAALRAAENAPATRPNVLLIISDDQGFGDFGFNGNRLVRTPNLDRLARESAVFRNFIVAPACSPTRAALFTGRDHLLTGVWGVPPRANLRPDEVRMPAFFKAAGYRTLHVGKLDCARAGRSNPDEFGWDQWLGGGGYEHKDPMIYQRGNNRREQGYAADLWTDHALRFIAENRDRPWFASVAYIIPHMPWVCDEKYSEPFVARGCSRDLAACYGSIAHLDECIGRLLDGLRQSSQDRQTIVIFLSDNGPTSPDIKAMTDADGRVRDDDWAKRNVANLRGHKAMAWENGCRVPMLLRWPGQIAAGDRRQLGCAEDLLPTLLDLAGIKADILRHHPFGGVSLRPALANADAVFERPAIFRMAIAGPGAPRDLEPHQPRRFEDHHLALRGPRFVYHCLPRGQSALHDLEADPGQTADVKEKFPDVAAKMADQCRRRWDAIISSGRAFAPPAE